ncbi:hypothetical protein [Hymenobacter negativus]|uniref:DUF4476 domain-containing protein n=1 Tax=Hymenobacter negativus TaxID=2795026 RepID=A0ABS0Q4D5_9BACT|nr:hypothetical protein [Hymenobacter negativus]MBH8557425.1 hypothetical protein [Hymenobacter negativus]
MKPFPFRIAALLLLTAATAQAQVPRRTPAAGSTPSTSQPHDYPLPPAPRYATGGYSGSYRLPDGSWHPAEIFGPDMPDRVRLRPENLPDYALFLPNEVPAYVVRGDTFVTVPAFVRHKGHQLVPAGYAQRVYRDADYEVLVFQAPTPETLRAFNTPAVPNGPLVSSAGALPATATSTADAFSNSFFGALLDLFVFPRANQTVLLRHAGQVQELPAKTRRYRQLMLALLADDPAVCAQLRAGQLATRREAPQLLATCAAHRREALLQARK